ncbi:MAG: hypothetical protein CML13_09750 [Puniceicoccaceae bacterium]|nr:hypothetical protein [Puniceicoccaceae bacterium]|tara:strand:- start:10350 stop:11501 length:1152 start_codon:yes stop_codon:yes gene_type:complete
MISKENFTDDFPLFNLKEVAEFLDGKRRPVKESERTAGNYAYYGANGKQGTINDFIFDEPTILLAEDGGHFWNPDRGVAYKVEGKYWVNNHAHVLQPKDGICINYLCRVLENYDLRQYVTGTTRGKLTKGSAEQIQIPLPMKNGKPDLLEQQRIAGILDQADAIRRKRQQALQLTDDFLRATFLDLFGDPVTNPKGWEECTVGDETDCIVPGRDKPKSFTGSTPWVTTADLNHLGITSKSSKKMGLSKSEILEVRARVIPEKSVLISCVGDLGISSLAGCDQVINQQLHSFQCGQKLLPEFLMYCLPFRKEWMLQRATKTTLPYLNKTNCNSIPIVLPPRPKQEAFAKVYNQVMLNKAPMITQQTASEHLFASLQQRAFKGEL